MDGITYQGIGFTVKETDQNWKIVGVGDFNGDGKPDILWRNTSPPPSPLSGEVGVWYMDGITYQGYALTVKETDLNWKIVGVGDFNMDIKPDILWRNTSNGENRVWYMKGMQKIGEAQLLTVTDLTWMIVG